MLSVCRTESADEKKGGLDGEGGTQALPGGVPEGWEVKDRLLERKLWFGSTLSLSLYVSFVLALAVKARVGVTLACSGRRLQVTLMDPSNPHGEVSRRLFNLAARLG